MTTAQAADVARLKQENAELRRANEILKAAAIFFGAEPLCTVLTEHDIKISPSTYCEWMAKKPSRQQLRDEVVVELIRAEREHPQYGRFASTLGSRKMWIRLRGKGHDVARCTVERLMRANEWEGARYGKKHITKTADDTHSRFPDLVDRNFNPCAPNRFWVADFTYVPTWTETVHVAFVIDAFGRRIIGWRAARSMTTPLVLDAGVDPSVGSVADAYDNALAESTVGSFKTERPHEYLAALTPEAAEQLHYDYKQTLATVG